MSYRKQVVIRGIGSTLVLAAQLSYAQSPDHVWSQRFGSTGADVGTKIAVDPSGNVLVTGHFAATVDFGGGPLTSAGNTDIFLAKYDPSGIHQWSKSFGGASADDAFDVATDASGNVFITGSFQGTTDFGGVPLVSAGFRDIFIAKYDATGVHQWSKRFGGASDDDGHSVAVDAAGFLVATGRSNGQVNFGGGIIDMHAGGVFLAKYNPGGAHVWSRGFDNHDSLEATAVAVDATGNVFLTGSFSGTVSFGGGILTSSEIDIFLAKYSASGLHRWSRGFGSAPRDAAYDVVTDASGGVVITGFFGFQTNGGTIDFGGGPLVGAGSADIFVAKFDTNAAHQWSRRFGGTDFDTALSVAADATGNVVITGRFRMGADFGGDFFPVAGLNDVFLAKYNASGIHQWSQRFGSTGSDVGIGLAADASGNTLVTGDFTGTVGFGGVPLGSAGGADVFVAKFADPAPVPVLITSFSATAHDGAVEILWTVWSDESLESFTLFRREDNAHHAIPIATGRIAARRGSYTDLSAEPGRLYHYQLLVLSRDGSELLSPVATTTGPVVVASLGQNRPNPFNPTTSIEYTLSEQSPAVLAIYDASGALVVRLDQGVQEAGTHQVEWNSRDARGQFVGSGVYFYQLESVPRIAAKKMVLLK